METEPNKLFNNCIFSISVAHKKRNVIHTTVNNDKGELGSEIITGENIKETC